MTKCAFTTALQCGVDEVGKKGQGGGDQWDCECLGIWVVLIVHNESDIRDGVEEGLEEDQVAFQNVWISFVERIISTCHIGKDH